MEIKILPFRAAQINAVFPNCPTTLTSAPFWMSSSATLSNPKRKKKRQFCCNCNAMVLQWFYIPAEIARISGVLEKMLRTSMSAPLSRSSFTLFSRPVSLNSILCFIILYNKSKYLCCNYLYYYLNCYHVKLPKEVQNFYYYSLRVCLWLPLDPFPQLLWINESNGQKYNARHLLIFESFFIDLCI